MQHFTTTYNKKAPADADKPVRRKKVHLMGMPKIAPIRRENKLQTS